MGHLVFRCPIIVSGEINNNEMIRSLDTHIAKKNADKTFYEFFEGILTDEIEEKYKSGCWDYIGEMLQSHDASKLIDALKKHIGSALVNAETFHDKDVDIVALTFSTPLNANNFYKKCSPTKEESDDAYYMNFTRDNDTKDLLNFFNYFATYKDGNIVYLEPKFTEEMSVEEYDDCNGIFFHLAEKDDLKSIMSNGFRIRNKRTDNTSVRYYPKRIYMFAPKDNLRNLDEQLKKFADKFIEDKQFRDNKVFVKINMNNFKNKRIFKDLAMEHNGCYFVYTNIPTHCISIYKDYKDYKNLNV